MKNGSISTYILIKKYEVNVTCMNNRLFGDDISLPWPKIIMTTNSIDFFCFYALPN